MGGTPRKKRTKKPQKRCRVCGVKFRTRAKIARHRLAHLMADYEDALDFFMLSRL